MDRVIDILLWPVNNWEFAVAFIVVLSVLIFFHELGHYYVARLCGVKVETFSIGFGREIFGFTDRSGTRWKVAMVPLGGYVKMFGDKDEFSAPDGSVRDMTAEERAVSFHHKSVGKRAAIVAAGPIANFLLAIALFAMIFVVAGRPSTPPVVGEVRPGSAAELAGLKSGDRFVSLDGRGIDRFEDVQQIVRLHPEQSLAAVIERGGERLSLSVTPRADTLTDHSGNKHRIGVLGVTGGNKVYEPVGLGSALTGAVEETWNTTWSTLAALGQIVTGTRSAAELGGPLAIGDMAGRMWQLGIVAVLTLMAVLSVNLGLLNLFPIPVLDGGHLMFYAYEAVRGRPLGERAQEYAFRVGLVLVIGLMLFVTTNDIMRLI